MTLHDVRELVASDIARFAEDTGRPNTFFKKVSAFFMPSIQSIMLHRISRYCYLRGWTVIARVFYTINLVVWGADIGATTSIGHSLYMPHPVGINIFGVLGNRCTCYTQCGIGGGSGNETDIGAGPGLPVLGDGVLIGARSLIIGPIRIGDGCLIGANAFVTFDVPACSTVVSKPSTIL